MPDQPDTHWKQMATLAAREISRSGPEQPPLGFSARVAARAMADRRQQATDPWIWALRWMLPASAAPAFAALIFYTGVNLASTSSNDPWIAMETDPVVLLDL